MTTPTTQPKRLVLQEAWKLVSPESKNRTTFLVFVATLSLLSFVNGIVFTYFAPVIDGILMTFMSLGVIFWTKESFEQRTPLLEDVFKKSADRWLFAFLTSFVMGLCLLGLTLLFVIPAIIMGVFWAFTIQIVFFEGKTFFQAMGRSRELVTGKWWDVMWLSIQMFFIALGVIILVSIAQFILHILLSPRLTEVLVDFTIHGLGAYFTVAMTLLYFEYAAAKTPVDVPQPIVGNVTN